MAIGKTGNPLLHFGWNLLLLCQKRFLLTAIFGRSLHMADTFSGAGRHCEVTGVHRVVSPRHAGHEDFFTFGPS